MNYYVRAFSQAAQVNDLIIFTDLDHAIGALRSILTCQGFGAELYATEAPADQVAPPAQAQSSQALCKQRLPF